MLLAAGNNVGMLRKRKKNEKTKIFKCSKRLCSFHFCAYSAYRLPSCGNRFFLFCKKKILYKLFSIVKLMSPFKVCHKDVKESFAIFFSIIFAMSKQKKGNKKYLIEIANMKKRRFENVKVEMA